MNKASSSVLPFLLVLVLMGIWSCKKEFIDLEFISATTLMAVPIGVNTVRLSGTLTNVNATFEPNVAEGKSYGFLVAKEGDTLVLDNPNLSPIEISAIYDLDAGFTYDLEVPSISDTYFYTTYVKFGERVHYGDTFSFNLTENVRLALSNSVVIKDNIGTLNMGVFLSFQDTITNLGIVYADKTENLQPGSTMAVTRNISATNDVGGKEVLTKELDFNTTYYAVAFAEVEEEIIRSDTISFQTTDGWKLVASIESRTINSPMGLGTTDFAWFGMGCAEECASDFKSTFWKFDPALDTFYVFESDIPGRTGGTSFVLNNKIYFGLGEKENRNMDDFWELNPSNPEEGWTEIPLPTTFKSGSNSVVLVDEVAGIAHIGTGDLVSLDSRADFQAFNPNNVSDSLEYIPNIPLTFGDNEFDSGRSEAYSFELNGAHYIGGGHAGVNLDDLYVFREGEWKFVTKTPFEPRRSAMAFSINGKAYVTLGNNDEPNGQLYDIWEMNSAFEWTKKASLPEGLNFRPDSEIAFITQEKIFIGATNDTRNSFDIWEYTPER